MHSLFNSISKGKSFKYIKLQLKKKILLSNLNHLLKLLNNQNQGSQDSNRLLFKIKAWLLKLIRMKSLRWMNLSHPISSRKICSINLLGKWMQLKVKLRGTQFFQVSIIYKKELKYSLMRVLGQLFKIQELSLV
jgi:hypothetical protein